MPSKQIFKVVFVNQSQIYELYARHVYQGEMYGFVVVEDFVFGESSSIVVDPGEEKLKTEFADVKRSFIPMHEIIRIDQVEKRGAAKILPVKEGSGKVASIYPPEKK